MIKNLVLIGVGLIGGSLALDLRRRGWVGQVVGVDIDQNNLTCALERGLIDAAYTEINALSMAEADYVVVATPVGTLPQVCRQLARYVAPQTVISDVGSTKQLALQAFAAELPQHYGRCVAAHPIAGSDQYGARSARHDLFTGKKCIVCPHEQQDKPALARVQLMWEAVGAEVVMLSAAEHDTALAAVSHLPHMLAYAYMHQLAIQPAVENLLNLAGSGFRDFSRIAASSPAIWSDICLANREPLQLMLQQQQQTLQFLQSCLQQQDHAALKAFFTTAQQTREGWHGSEDHNQE